MSLVKKIVTSILLALFVSVSLLSPFVKIAHAQQSTWYFPNYDEWYTRVMDKDNPDEIFGERYTFAQVIWIIYSLIAFILDGMGNKNLALCIIKNANDLVALGTECGPILNDLNKTGYLPKVPNNSPLAFLLPGNTISYFKSIGQKLDLIPEARAQAGFGFERALNPVQRIWSVVRNLTYFLLVLAIVVVSFMIMFRIKTSPQTIITIQSAIPKIIIALILITFSYAIAGFLIDLMYVVIGLISSILANSGLTTGSETFASIFRNLTSRSALDFMFSYFVAFIVIALLALFSNTIGISALIGIVGVGVANPATLLILLILALIILIVLLVLAFKVWIMLLKAFVNVLLFTIIAPIQILLGVFGYGGFSTWLRSMLSNLAVFPVAGVMFFVAFIFLAASIPASLETIPTPWGSLAELLARLMPFNPDPAAFGASPWIPPLTWATTDTDILWLAVSIVIISLIPKTADIIKSLITEQPFAYGAAIGEALAIPKAAGRYVLGLGKAGVEKGVVGYISPKVEGWIARRSTREVGRAETPPSRVTQAPPVPGRPSGFPRTNE